MSVNLETHITAPDLIEPVIGFRSWTYIEPHPAMPAEYRVVGKKEYSPFVAPREYVTLPDGKVTLNMKAVGEAWVKWRDSIYGEGRKVLVRAELEASEGYIHSRAGFKWKPGRNEAETCTMVRGVGEVGYRHTAPKHGCECGLYCYYEPDKVGTRNCMGIVSCSGIIEAHVTGMRSQYMKIEHLFGGPNLQVLADRWEIPFTNVYQFGGTKDVNKAIKATAQEYGSVLPESMRPKASKESSLATHKRMWDRLLQDVKLAESRGVFQQKSHHWGTENEREAAYRQFLQKPSKELEELKNGNWGKPRTLKEQQKLMEQAARMSEQTMRDILGGQS